MKNKWINKIHCGNSLKVLKAMPDNFVDMVMTSPPYWGLRDYGVKGQFGLEKTFQEYITKLCDIFDDIKRTLKDTGTIWVNLGDTYSSTAQGTMGVPPDYLKGSKAGLARVNHRPITGIASKSLCMIPQRFAIEMVNRGWILRNTIIWYKSSCMPCSAKDRFTVDFEYLYFFSKQKKYYFEQQFDAMLDSSIKRLDQDIDNQIGSTRGHGGNKINGNMKAFGNIEQGRNKRCVWNINPSAFSEAHFSVYPEELCITPINAGCPEFICKKCGKAKEKILKVVGEFQRRWPKNNAEGSPYNKQDSMQNIYKEVGYTDCKCKAGFNPGIVMDPFSGAGTTSLVARKLGRNYIGIEINPEYVKMSEKRIHNTAGLL